jgi:hypothetical protein
MQALPDAPVKAPLEEGKCMCQRKWVELNIVIDNTHHLWTKPAPEIPRLYKAYLKIRETQIRRKRIISIEESNTIRDTGEWGLNTRDETADPNVDAFPCQPLDKFVPR